jgi:hypothetical protein
LRLQPGAKHPVYWQTINYLNGQNDEKQDFEGWTK